MPPTGRGVAFGGKSGTPPESNKPPPSLVQSQAVAVNESHENGPPPFQYSLTGLTAPFTMKWPPAIAEEAAKPLTTAFIVFLRGQRRSIIIVPRMAGGLTELELEIPNNSLRVME